jgi:hypothetical protein
VLPEDAKPFDHQRAGWRVAVGKQVGKGFGDLCREAVERSIRHWNGEIPRKIGISPPMRRAVGAQLSRKRSMTPGENDQ